MKGKGLVVFLSAAFAVQAAAVFEFPVARKHIPRDELGMLTINEAGVDYRSANGKVRIQLPFIDIRRADLSNPTRIEFETYDRLKRTLTAERTYKFKLQGEPYGEELTRFLEDRLKRPVVGSYSLPDRFTFAIPAYHPHGFGGSAGILEFGEDGIRFVSKQPNDSRTWIYRDIASIGSSGPFSFRITTYSETFTFDLKERLPDGAYQLAWRRVYMPDALPGKQP